LTPINPNNRLLVVDDEAGLRTSLAANLELEGYRVVEAEGGAQAVELVREGGFDLVISDVRMPDVSGVDAFREIRRLRPEIPVILMTAFTVEKVLAEALGEGVFAVMQKPFAIEHAIGLVAHALSGPVVLVVDDTESEATTAVAALRSVGIDRKRNVDVCVLDLVMPGMDGIKTYEHLRRVAPSLTVIAMSGHPVPGMMHAIMTMGGYACLRKPFHMTELIRAIARARGEARG
jgi:two-component system response regulator HydG